MLKACCEYVKSMLGAGWEQVKRSLGANCEWVGSNLGEGAGWGNMVQIGNESILLKILLVFATVVIAATPIHTLTCYGSIGI